MIIKSLKYYTVNTYLGRCAAMASIKSDPPADLLTMLKNFAGTRHHSALPHGKQNARVLINKEFEAYGLHVWSEHALIWGVSIFESMCEPVTLSSI